jgi:hypothetical protein
MDEILSLPGKFMALAARGKHQPKWDRPITQYFRKFNVWFWASERRNCTEEPCEYHNVTNKCGAWVCVAFGFGRWPCGTCRCLQDPRSPFSNEDDGTV